MLEALSRSPARIGARLSLPPAVVVGLDSMQGLQVCRILAAEGVPVHAISKSRDYYSTRTRVCESILYTDTGGDLLIGTLRSLAERLGERAVLIGCQDKNIAVISEKRALLDEGYHITLPPHEVVEQLADKAKFAELADQLDIPIPASCGVTSRDEALEASSRMNYPCVIKPASRTRSWLSHTKAKAIRAENASELMRIYDKIGGWVDSLVIQEWIEGSDDMLYSFNGYFDRQSQPLATFIARKVRQYPPDIGQSSSGVEVRADEVLHAALSLFQAVGTVGFAYLEMKRDARDGRFYVIEPNIGRPTGRSAIAEAGGVPLHFTGYCDAAGLPLPPDREQQYGDAKWIHLLRDTQSAWIHYRRGDLGARTWLQSIRGRKAYAVASWSDPMPFIAAVRTGLKGVMSSGEGRSEVLDV